MLPGARAAEQRREWGRGWRWSAAAGAEGHARWSAQSLLERAGH